jgi:hypothetical protein
MLTSCYQLITWCYQITFYNFFSWKLRMLVNVWSDNIMSLQYEYEIYLDLLRKNFQESQIFSVVRQEDKRMEGPDPPFFAWIAQLFLFLLWQSGLDGWHAENRSPIHELRRITCVIVSPFNCLDSGGGRGMSQDLRMDHAIGSTFDIVTFQCWYFELSLSTGVDSWLHAAALHYRCLITEIIL